MNVDADVEFDYALCMISFSPSHADVPIHLDRPSVSHPIVSSPPPFLARFCSSFSSPSPASVAYWVHEHVIPQSSIPSCVYHRFMSILGQRRHTRIRSASTSHLAPTHITSYNTRTPHNTPDRQKNNMAKNHVACMWFDVSFADLVFLSST